MFGAVFIFLIIINSIIALCKNVKHNLENRREFRHPESNTYLSYDGTFRDLDTGGYRFFYRNSNGDLFMTGEGISEVNISQRKRELEFKKDCHPGRTACFYANEPPLIKFGSPIKRGCRYKDYKTGEIYVIRRNKIRQKFYVTMDNKVVRFTDGYRERLESKGIYNKEKELVAIRDFQNKIDSVIDKEFWKIDPTLIECYDYEGKYD